MFWACVLSVAAFVMFAVLLRDAVTAWFSPEYRREVKSLREQRRIRKAARRSIQ